MSKRKLKSKENYSDENEIPFKIKPTASTTNTPFKEIINRPLEYKEGDKNVIETTSGPALKEINSNINNRPQQSNENESIVGLNNKSEKNIVEKTSGSALNEIDSNVIDKPQQSAESFNVKEPLNSVELKTVDENAVAAIDNINPILRRIHYLINHLDEQGDDSTGGEASELPSHPGLHVNNFGQVPLPLCEWVGEALIALAKQAPFGFKFKNSVDTDVRDAFEIQPSEFEIQNPNWNNGLDALVKRIAVNLGCHGEIEAKIYKMLIYRKDGHFKKHVDTEKEKNMIATLIIQLPSSHEGGELIIHHKNENQETVYDFGHSTGLAPYSHQFVAHYADIEHEIKEIKSGYRLALVYSLCWKFVNSKKNKITNNYEELFKMTSYLDELNKLNSGVFGILCKHKYTEKSMFTNGTKALKAVDYERFELMQRANDKLHTSKKFLLFIVQAELVVTESVRHMGIHKKNKSYDESDGYGIGNFDGEGSYELKEWYDPSGKIIKAKGFTLDHFKRLIDPDRDELKPFSRLKHEDSWDYDHASNFSDAYYGNEAPTSPRRTYKKYIIVLIPKSQEFKTFFKNDVDQSVADLFKLFNNNPQSREIVDHFKTLVSYLGEFKDLESTTINMIIDLCEKLNNIEICQLIIENLVEFPIICFAKLVVQFGWDNLSKTILARLSKYCKNCKYCETNCNNEFIKRNCKFIRALFDLNQIDSAMECLQNSILAQFNKPSEDEDDVSDVSFELDVLDYSSNGNIRNKQPKNEPSIFAKASNQEFYVIGDTILHFANQRDVDAIMNEYTRFLKDIVNDNYVKSKLFALFIENKKHIKSPHLFKLAFDLSDFDSAIEMLFKRFYSYKTDTKFIDDLKRVVCEYTNSNVNYKSCLHLLIICNKIEDLDICKSLLAKLDRYDIDMYSLGELIHRYKWSELKESLSNLLRPNSILKLLHNCELVNFLSNNEPEVTIEVFELALMPIFDESSKFFEVTQLEPNDNFDLAKSLSSLAETLCIMKNLLKNENNLFESYTSLLKRINARVIERLMPMLIICFDEENSTVLFKIYLVWSLHMASIFLFDQLNEDNELIKNKTFLDNCYALADEMKYEDKRLTINDESTSNLIELCKRINNLELCKSLLINMRWLTANPQGILDLISTYTWQALKESLRNLLNPDRITKLTHNCHLVQKLIDLRDISVAFDCFQIGVLPLLDKSKEFYAQSASNYYMLAQTIWLFKYTSQDENSKLMNEAKSKYFNMIIKHLELDAMKDLLNLFETNKEWLKSRTILKLFEHYLNLLSITAPQFDWWMPGKLPNYPQLNEFFASPTKSKCNLSSIFKGIGQARKFAKMFEGFKKANGYSVMMEPNGYGQNAYVKITKTREYYENVLVHNPSLKRKAEIEYYQTLIKTSNEEVKQ